MNVKVHAAIRAVVKAWVIINFLIMSQWSMALGVPDLLNDPLLTRPPALDAGTTLRGDASPVACPVEADFAQPLSLTTAVGVGLCHNPQVQGAWAGIRQRAAALGEARSAYLPTLTGSVSQLRNRTGYPGLPSSDSANHGHTTYAAFNLRLFDFGERAANRVAANDLLAAALSSYDAATQTALADIIGAWFDVQTAQAALAARGFDRQYAGMTLVTAQRRERTGATGRNDTLQASTALARAELAEHRATGDVRKAQAALVYAMGVTPGTTVVLPPDSTPLPDEAIQDLSHWLQFAKWHHPAIAAAHNEWNAAEEKVSGVRAQGLPTVDFGVNWYQNGYPNQGLQPVRSNTTTIGITVTIPLFEGFTRTYKIRQAQAEADQSEVKIQETEQQVLREVVKAHADALSSLANLDSSAGLVRTAEAALSSSRNRYEHGVADIVELLNAQTALADAHQERIRCTAEWRSARLRLLADTGLLGTDAVRELSTLGEVKERVEKEIWP
ncbi:TolC family protein [Paraburkholderia sp. NPDC080076]|uniref:TolC family protein n=1 Tax=Paraburkholderia sp. NPDC080076 TaxID=3390605 RepID=UPI003CFD0DAC